ncbi:MAG TPA: hypothetical protein PKE16_08770 [Hyphomicrobium sp.]|nr:hypothetical protein [Hyphomicrobium sp.]
MIVRSAFKCLTCGQVHTVRIGIGLEEYQDHRFPCTACQEPLVIAVHLNFAKFAWRLEPLENAERCAEIGGAPIVNVDANFIVPKEQRHADKVFPRLTQMHAMSRAAENAGRLGRQSPIGPLRERRPLRRPDFLGEWRVLKKAWSLRRNAHEKLSDRKVTDASAVFYADDPLKTFDDWLWRFLRNLSPLAFLTRFEEAFAPIKQLLGTPEFERFLKVYDALSAERGTRNYDLLRAYFAAYSDYSQVLFLIIHGLPIPAGDAASTVNFDATRMFYGNAFEAFSSSVDILAYLNNMIEGRPFDTFQTMTRDNYLALDKANRCQPFAANPAFASLCGEFDNQLRNASHHGGFAFDGATQVIRYRTGRGGMGSEHMLHYVSYLDRSTHLFLQAMTLLQVEIMLCHATGRRVPV